MLRRITTNGCCYNGVQWKPIKKLASHAKN